MCVCVCVCVSQKDNVEWEHVTKRYIQYDSTYIKIIQACRKLHKLVVTAQKCGEEGNTLTSR